MLRKNFVSLALASAMVAACGGDDSTGNGDHDGGDLPGNVGDAGHDAGTGPVTTHDAGADAGTDPGRLATGTYLVSNVVKISDDCGLVLEDGTFKMIDVSNIAPVAGGPAKTLQIGAHYTPDGSDIQWTPEGYALGQGDWTSATDVTTKAMSHVKFTDDGCEFDVSRTSIVKHLQENVLDIDYTDTETGQNAKCKASNSESTATCTSHYTFTLTRKADT